MLTWQAVYFEDLVETVPAAGSTLGIDAHIVASLTMRRDTTQVSSEYF